MAGTRRQQELSKIAKQHGARNYSLRIMIDADRTEHVSKSLGCALIEQESGFRNVFGHDQGQPFAGAGTVTEAKYKAYRRTGGQQGVGPAQLTSHGYQNQADRLGGCWVPRHNIRVAFMTLDTLIGRYGVRRGLASYNAGERGWRNGLDYAEEVLTKQQRWHRRLT